MDQRTKFLDAMRRAASSVAVVTTGGPAGVAGITVSALCPLSADPPSVLVCVNQSSPVQKIIRSNGCFCVNILNAHQHRVADSFAGRIPELREDRFACATWRPGFNGAPELDDALAVLNCKLVNETAFASHYVLIGEIMKIVTDGQAPLIYVDRGYHHVGDRILSALPEHI